MSATINRFRQSLYGLFLLFLLSAAGVAQNASVNSGDSPAIPLTIDTELPPMSHQSMLASLIETETRIRLALHQHTFKRDVTLQTIGPNGEVTGEYIRNSQFVFDDSGNRIERVLYHPASTLRRLKITREDIQDLAGAQLLGIDVTEKLKYRMVYAGTEQSGSNAVLAFDVTPVLNPNPRRMRERFFVGRVWADARTFQIVKVKGVVAPSGKQRFPVFETVRESIGQSLWFPTSTHADDILHFPTYDVHYRIRVRYYDYQRFASKLTITEIDQPSAHPFPVFQPPPGNLK